MASSAAGTIVSVGRLRVGVAVSLDGWLQLVGAHGKPHSAVNIDSGVKDVPNYCYIGPARPGSARRGAAYLLALGPKDAGRRVNSTSA